jgi:hypothetical protein
VNVINVKKAIELFEQNKDSSDEHFLLNIFLEIPVTQVVKTSINIPASILNCIVTKIN